MVFRKFPEVSKEQLFSVENVVKVNKILINLTSEVTGINFQNQKELRMCAHNSF